MVSSLRYNLAVNLKNIPGPRVEKKIVVIECDDYGGIRMPSLEAMKKMKAAGVSIDESRYNLLDTLEDAGDLTALFEVLQSVKGADGKHAVISPFVNVANPDFEKIKTALYKEYFYEPFPITYKKYGRSSNMMGLWKKGIEAGIFTPEFHGREHVSVQPWMQKLLEGNIQLQHAFSYGFVAVGNIQGVHPYAQEFRPEFYFNGEQQKTFLHRSIIEGVQLFEQLFGYTPSAFMPSNSVFHPDFEETVLQTGIPFLVVAHKNPTPGLNGDLMYTNFTFRQKLQSGKLNFYIRNCAFEPTDNSYTSVDSTMKQIQAAFRWNKPAIISTHRVNFTGGIDKRNRDKGLAELGLLLKRIKQQWPAVEFVSTKEFTNLLLKKNKQ